MKTFYLTTAIDYPSGPPHIGHAYEKILGDCIARWHRLLGEDVFFLAGTDEHGQKIEKYAGEAGKTPQTFVNEMSSRFAGLWEKLDISNDSFIRTTDRKHINVCRDIFAGIFERGEIYGGEYKGLYCIDCEAYYGERELVEGKCPVHGRVLEKIAEKGYFFRMSKYSDYLLRFIEENENFILPVTRRNEIINRIKGGIKDLCISRSAFRWGVPMPNDDTHIIFVWFDALLNYISGIDYPGGKFEKYWPADIQIVGKDILWFHAVVWPSILLAAGLELPKQIFVHGFVNVSGEKLSKSKGVKIDPFMLADKFGADALRYFLIREIPYGEDGNFSEEALIKRINNDLANDLGNLLSRTLAMIEKYFCGKIPAAGEITPLDKELMQTAGETVMEVVKHFSRLNPGEALTCIWKLINRSNKYIEETSPWKLAKEEKEKKRLGTVLYQLAESLRLLSILIFPFMPETSSKMRAKLGIGGNTEGINFKQETGWGKTKPGQMVKKAGHLFQKIL